MKSNKCDIFIHYGHKKFSDALWNEIKNINFVKPHGGLWASRVGAKYGWKEWNDDNQFRDCNISNSFKFKLKENSKVLYINKVTDLLNLPLNNSFLNDYQVRIGEEVYTTDIFNKFTHFCLDFEKLKQSYDAIEVNISNDKQLYWKLYGWDCDSILILNKNVIQIVEGGQ